jgi:hypothetical protein
MRRPKPATVGFEQFEMAFRRRHHVRILEGHDPELLPRLQVADAPVATV